MSPTPEQVSAAAAAWIWVPEDARTVQTAECLLVRFPDHFPDPLVVASTATYRSDLVDEVLARAAELEGPELDGAELTWWVRLDAPAGLEDGLVARGGVRDETVDVLARPLGPGDPPDVGSPGLELRWQVDLPTMRDGDTVGVAVFGGTPSPEARLVDRVAGDRADIGQGNGGEVVAYLDGRPVGAAGVSVVDGVARLWGGGVVEDARRRGVYGALLAERLAYGRRFGATMALVKGRVETSGPILRRAGFASYGQERSYRLALPG